MCKNEEIGKCNSEKNHISEDIISQQLKDNLCENFSLAYNFKKFCALKETFHEIDSIILKF